MRQSILHRFPLHIVGWALVLALAIAGLLVALDRGKLLWEAPDRVTYDWRTYILTSRADKPNADIAVLLIDEQTLASRPYISPIDRGVTARLIDDLVAADVRAIGVDFYYDRPSEPAKDEELARALKAASARIPVVVAANDSRSGPTREELAFQGDFLARAGVKTGHIYLGTDEHRISLGDRAIRYVAKKPDEAPGRDAFASVLASSLFPDLELKSRLISWQHHTTADGADYFTTLSLPTAAPEDKAAGGGVLPQGWDKVLKGKIVLVGGGFRDRDLHLTPLSVANDVKQHGVLIHAQILAQILDGRSVAILSTWKQVVLTTIVVLVGLWVGHRWRLSGTEWQSSALAFIVFVAASFAAFGILGVVLPTAAMFIAWPVGLFLGRRISIGDEASLSSTRTT